MPTTVVKTIRASGGDYTTLTAWEAANQGNLVTADEIRVAECYDDWPSGLDDAVTIDGSTTDATRYLKITVAAGHRHAGIPGAGFYLARGYGTDIVLVKDEYTQLEYLEVRNTSGSSGTAIALSVSNISLRDIIASASTYALYSSASDLLAINVLAINSGTGFRAQNARSNRLLYNSIAANCGTGFFCGIGTGGFLLKNSVAYNNTTNYSDVGNTGSTNNATSSASDDAPGAGSVVGITSADFVNAAGNDYHLAAGSTLIGAGVNLYADFQADVDGDAWPSSGAWDVGFDHYVAAGGGVTGTLSVTLENFTSSINGTTTIVGTIAQTMAAFTSAITGTSEVPGTIAATTEDAVGALEGTVGTDGPTGTITGLVEDSMASMAGSTSIVGTMNVTLEENTSSITGTTTVVGQMAASVAGFVSFIYGTSGLQTATNRLLALIGVGK